MSRKFLIILLTLVGTLSLCALGFSKAQGQSPPVQNRRMNALRKDADYYLSEGEKLESQKQYASAENYYRRYVETMHVLEPKNNYDGILGRIADLAGKHWEANKYYTSFESSVAKQHPEKFGTVVSMARLLRILQTLPRKQATEEFDFAGEILAEEFSLAPEIGTRADILDLRPLAKDYQKEAPNLPAQGTEAFQPKVSEAAPSKDQIGPRPDATVIVEVNTAGIVVQGAEMRGLLGKLDRQTACREFDFALDFHPDFAKRIWYENYSDCPLSGYTGINSVRKLVPKQVLILDKKTYEKLIRLSENAKVTNSKRVCVAPPSTWTQKDYCNIETASDGIRSQI